MAQPVTLYRFKIELSDIDRGVYDTLELRVAMHPSESVPYLLTRVFAFALNWQEGLEFSPQGLGDSEVPALRGVSPTGNIDLWIEIGSPSAKKLHKASKVAKQVKVYTYKDPKVFLKELASHYIHRQDEIECFAVKAKQLEKVEAHLTRDNRWTLVKMDGMLTVNMTTPSGDMSEVIEILPLVAGELRGE